MIKKQTRISVTSIRQGLKGTRMPSDPTRPVMPEGSANWPAAFLERASSGLKAAAVLIPIIEREAGLTVLLTQRSAELRVHAGQVSFPGGRMDEGDSDILQTALRETHEEVGIHPDWVEIAGYLDPLPTVTGFAVTPVVGIVGPRVSIVVDPREVEAAFEVPLEFLLDKRNQTRSTREFEGVQLRIVEFNFAGQRIWGATATMLVQLRKKLIKQ
jgi:8-oxo-dGTP pyrophosphatase MutT (NUDIX family)